MTPDTQAEPDVVKRARRTLDALEALDGEITLRGRPAQWGARKAARDIISAYEAGLSAQPEAGAQGGDETREALINPNAAIAAARHAAIWTLTDEASRMIREGRSHVERGDRDSAQACLDAASEIAVMAAQLLPAEAFKP